MSALHPVPPEAVPARWRLRLAFVLAVLGLPFLGTCALAWDSFATRHDRAALRLLDSADPDARRLGASLAAREEAPQALVAIGLRARATHRARSRGPRELRLCPRPPRRAWGF